MKDFKTIETARHLILTYKDLDPCILDKGSEKCSRVLSLLKENRHEALVDYLFPGLEVKETLTVQSNGKFRLDKSGNVFVSGEKAPVHKVIGMKILEFHRAKADYKPLIQFWKNLQKNPSENSKNQLFQFLTANHHPITQDGCFIAYKYVHKNSEGRLLDCHTKTFDNSIGKVVKVDRSKVDPNHNQTCSYGLHVAAHAYASSNGGSVTVEVKVNPKDVVAVPPDYNQQKMRVCEYKVLAHATNEIKKSYISLKEINAKQAESKSAQKKEINSIKKEKKPTIKKDSKSKATVVKNGKVVDFEGCSASQIMDAVYKLTHKKITCSTKSKKSVVRQAQAILTEKGYRPNF